jgi:hypothetical protein
MSQFRFDFDFLRNRYDYELQRKEQLTAALINAADRNTETNDERSGLLHRARLALFAVLLLTVVAGFPYVVDQVRF